MLLIHAIGAKTMILGKIINAIINIILAISAALLLLTSAPWSGAPVVSTLYYITLSAFWFFLILRLLLTEWQKNHTITYKSFLGPHNEVRKRLIMPGSKEIAETAAVLLKPSYLLGLAGLFLLCVLNHLLLFYPFYTNKQFGLLFGLLEGSSISQESVLLAACLASVLALAGAVFSLSREIKQNNHAYNIQNLIINAHSPVALSEMQIRPVDGDQLMLTVNKLEYVLQSKPIAALRQPQQQTLIRLILSLNLSGDIPVTEFFIKRFSMFIGDIAIECESNSPKFYPLYAVDNVYALDFYILSKEVLPQRLNEKFILATGLRLYYSLLLKNSVGVVTELYGVAFYEKNNITGSTLHYLLRENKGNQYFYV